MKEEGNSAETFVLQKIEEYLRKYPVPTSIEYIGNLFKLTHTFSSPYTDSKITKESYLTHQALEKVSKIENANKRITHNSQKGKLEENNSFDSIMTKGKHEKIMQDDVFGKAEHTKDCSKWVYIAEIKQEEVKSYFNEGKGKLPFKHDFGETFENIRQVGIFVWDKALKETFRVPIDANLIPCYPSFSNQEGSEIVFHAYERQHFGYGLMFCFNRPIKIFKAQFRKLPKQEGKKQQPKQEKREGKEKQSVKAEVTQLFTTNTNESKLFPAISPCLTYLIYLSGTGKTHTFYKDFVICRKKEGEWVETHRIKEWIVGYNSTLKNYIIQEDGKIFGITQTMEKSCAQIYRIDLQSGDRVNLTEKFKGHTFQITSIDQGMIVGIVSTNSFNSFFFIERSTVSIIESLRKQDFIQEQYLNPIHALLVYAKEEDIWPEYQEKTAKRPLVVMPHGGPHGSFAHALSCLRYMLLKMGYFFLYINFSGSTGYGKEVLEASLTKIGEKDADEIIEVLKKVLSEHSNISKSDVHAYGGSYGGYMSVIFGSRYSQYFKSVVVMNGVINLIGNMWFSDIPEWNTVEALNRSQLHGLTSEDYQTLLRLSPSREPMKIPVLQFLGGKDRRVAWRQGLFFDAITKNAGIPIATYVYENSGHSLADSVETTIDIIVKSILFLEGQEEKEATDNKDEVKA